MKRKQNGGHRTQDEDTWVREAGDVLVDGDWSSGKT